MMDFTRFNNHDVSILYAGVSLLEPKATGVLCNAIGAFVEWNACQGPYKLIAGNERSVAITTAGAVDVTVHIKGLLLNASNIRTIVVAVPFELDPSVVTNFETAFRNEWPYPNVTIEVIADLSMAKKIVSPSGHGFIMHTGIQDREYAYNLNGGEHFSTGTSLRERLMFDSINAVRAAIGGKVPFTSLVPCFDAYLGIKGIVNFEDDYGTLLVEDRVKAINNIVKIVMDQAWQGDKIAQQKVDNLAKRYAELTVTTLRKLQLDNQSVPIGLYGDIWKYGDLVRRPFLDYVRRVVRDAYLDEQTHSLDEAAAIMAFKLGSTS